MTVLNWDYETYSELDLKEVGQWNYAMHPSTEVLCLGWRFDDDEPTIFNPLEDVFLPDEVCEAVRKGVPIYAWNANFERAITECLGAKYGIPTPKVSQWRCTMGLAAHLAMPMKLATCAAVLKIVEQKDKDGTRLLNKFSRPRKPTKADSRTRIRPQDDPEDFLRLTEYCKQDVRTEGAVAKALPIHELPAYEQRIWEVDSDVNKRGVLLDRDLISGAVRLLSSCQADGAVKMKEITGGLVTTAGQRERIKTFARSQGVELGSLAAEEMPGIMARDLPKNVRDLLEVYSSLGQSSTSKYPTMLGAMSPQDDRARGCAQYHSATTGRWGGRKVQFQNLPRPYCDVNTLRPEVAAANKPELDRISEACGLDTMTVLRDTLRHTVIAPPGKTLLVSDLSSIEARVLGWIANEEAYLKAFREKKDLYKVTAALIFNKRYEDIQKGSVERHLGKESVLGLGYQMGAETFIGNCRDKGIKPELASDALIMETCQKYRRAYTNIVKYWSDIEMCAVACVSTGKPTKLGRIRMEMVQGYLTIILPSGRRLWYAEAHTRMVRKFGKDKLQIIYSCEIHAGVWARNGTYGGKITENIVQAIARDILAEGLVNANCSGIMDPVMTVHDEIVAEADEGTDPELLAAIMSKNPPWADGLPLGADAFASPYYKK